MKDNYVQFDGKLRPVHHRRGYNLMLQAVKSMEARYFERPIIPQNISRRARNFRLDPKTRRKMLVLENADIFQHKNIQNKQSKPCQKLT
jgi:hypothetical protein